MELASREHKQEQQDAGSRKDDDFEELQAAAMQKITSQKVVLPTASRKHIQEVDVRKLTRSQKNRILDAGLQVTDFSIYCECAQRSTFAKDVQHTIHVLFSCNNAGCIVLII